MKTRLLILFGIIVISIGVFEFFPDAYASCAAPLFGEPGPCFDSFSGTTGQPFTEKSIMESFARNIEANYYEWEMSDRNWDNFDEELRLPAIICTEFVADGMTQYRMAKWVDAYKISSFEDHRNDLLCDKWLPPFDDGIKLKWDKELYSSDDIAQIQVIDKDMNLDSTLIDSFDIHVWSDIDHTGIQLTVTETEPDAGYFYGNVFLTTTNETSGARLLVEDGVHAEYKENYDFSRIINEATPEYTADVTDFRDTSGEIICKGYTTDGGFLEYPECGPIDQFVIHVLIIVLPIIGIVSGFIIWRKRK